MLFQIRLIFVLMEVWIGWKWMWAEAVKVRKKHHKSGPHNLCAISSEVKWLHYVKNRVMFTESLNNLTLSHTSSQINYCSCMASNIGPVARTFFSLMFTSFMNCRIILTTILKWVFVISWITVSAQLHYFKSGITRKICIHYKNVLYFSILFDRRVSHSSF